MVEAGAWVIALGGMGKSVAETGGGLSPLMIGSSSSTPPLMELLLTIESEVLTGCEDEEMTVEVMEAKGGGEGPVVEVILAPDRSNRFHRL